MPNDQELVTRIAGRDDGALAELYDRYAAAGMALAMRILGDRMEAEDVLQTVFIRVWDRAGEYNAAKGSVATWLLSSVRNASIDRTRRRDVRKRTAENAPPPAPPASPSPELREDQRRLADCVEELPSDQRAAIELAYFDGLSQSEIAVKAEEPLGTIKTRIRLGMEKLRDCMK